MSLARALPARARGAAAAVATAAVLLAPTVAVAAPAAPGGVVLAVEGGTLLGPDPQPRDAEGNPAVELGGYEDREVPFTWGAAWLLTFLGLAGLGFMGLVWFRAVDRPRRTPARR